MNILVIDIGGTNAKLWKSGETDKVKIPSNKKLTPTDLIDEAKTATADWKFDRVSIGYPGDVRHGHPVAEPWNLGNGWVEFDYATALGCPVRIMNDACMQALGSYEGGRMLYLGLGTSIGSAFIFDGTIVPLAVGHLKLGHGKSIEECVNREALEADKEGKWHKYVAEAATSLKNAFFADYVVLGGGNTKKLEELPEGCRRGGNHNAYFGGLRMWEDVK
ncbi:MAG TPA: ROK family protein [Lacipirellulaceae bacterium]|jgi:predicted NBD/HSP70 family sugar kinase|nr:ROK family protein [Lacipirellulaceae bacterium]